MLPPHRSNVPRREPLGVLERRKGGVLNDQTGEKTFSVPARTPPPAEATPPRRSWRNREDFSCPRVGWARARWREEVIPPVRRIASIRGRSGSTSFRREGGGKWFMRVERKM